jgi:hypothetical protein
MITLKPLASSLSALVIFLGLLGPAAAAIQQDKIQKTVTLSDEAGDLSLRLNYDNQCVLDQVTVRGRQVMGGSGAASGIQMSGRWFTTRRGIASPRVSTRKNSVMVNGIVFGSTERPIRETWIFQVEAKRILWRIDRSYPASLTLEDSAFPQWGFGSMSTWTGGILGNGGVVWNKYLENPNATYGARTDAVTFWNREKNDCLRITPTLSQGLQGAVRFSHQPSAAGEEMLFNYAVSGQAFQPKHNLNRFLWDHQDLWKPFQVQPGQQSVELSLQALEYDKAYDRGTFQGINGGSVRELMNTVGRYGVIDSQHIGTNGWRSGYICLHEQWLAQIGMALNDPNYTANFASTLDYWRDNAIKPDGRVLSRWKYDAGDAMRGTYTDKGFYEAQWGMLMDSQTDYVINVAEQFDMSGDTKWLAGQKEVCERVLNYLLRREVGNSGIVTMLTDSRLQNRGSDWFDIVWAAHQNALVNAELYHALNLWADAEEALGDIRKAAEYHAFATRLKTTFNKPLAEGGFWDPANKWYVYWRDKDGSVHGNNLFTAVNFTAIGYGVCDDKERQKAILDRIETEMQKEALFHWPTNFSSFQADEVSGGNMPYPKYENGDIFLSWGEMAVRAYAAYDPKIAVKYVRNVLDKYEKDGLSFQRYTRQSQGGAGDDILANNCLTIVGLYTDIYGTRPKPNRLYLEPHLTPELNGTQLKYQLRGQDYRIDLDISGSAITAQGITVRDTSPFGVNATPSSIEYFPGQSKVAVLSVSRPKSQSMTVQIENWATDPTAPRRWLEKVPSGKGKTTRLIAGLHPGAVYTLKIDEKTSASLQADKNGAIKFASKPKGSNTQTFELTRAAQ